MEERIGFVLFLIPATSPPETGDMDRLEGTSGDADLELEKHTNFKDQ